MIKWRPWSGGPAPDTAGEKILIRIRCVSREHVESQERFYDPSQFKGWRWTHDGGVGDIIEVGFKR